MRTLYKHRQTAYGIIALVMAPLLFLTPLLRREAGWPALLVVPVLALVSLVFSSLTVEVTGTELRASFGPGWTVKRVPLREVDSARVVRNPWHYGLGIRVTPEGMLYSVSGTRAVEVRLKDGTAFRLGSDEPEALREAIARAAAAPARA